MTCPLCASGHPRLWGEHVQVSERGLAVLGRCEAPAADKPRAQEFPFAERLAAWRDRIRGMGKHVDEPKPPPPHWLEAAANREEEIDGDRCIDVD